MSLTALRQKYREAFGEETQCRHREHLFRRIGWRLQALAEGDLTDRARDRAQQLARDADLRLVAPPGFFTLGGEPVRTTPGAGNRRSPDWKRSASFRGCRSSSMCRECSSLA